MKRPREVVDEVEMADTLMMLSRSDGGASGTTRSGAEDSSCGGGGGGSADTSPSREFECKTCSRRFPSFQALGGHRASHRKPKLENNGSGSPLKPKAHECSICGLEFAIGQALGGHMRRHRVMAEALPHPQPPPSKKKAVTRCLSFDLNLLPYEDETRSTKLCLGLGLALEA